MVLMKVEPAGESTVAEGARVVELLVAEVTERAEVDIPTQVGVSTQPEVAPTSRKKSEGATTRPSQCLDVDSTGCGAQSYLWTYQW